MAKPRRIKILGTWWTVNWTHDFAYELLGHTNQVTKEIHVRPNAEVEVFIHELVHAIDQSFGGNLEEEEVAMVGRGIFAILSDNPSVRKYLLEEFE